MWSIIKRVNENLNWHLINGKTWKHETTAQRHFNMLAKRKGEYKVVFIPENVLKSAYATREYINGRYDGE